MFGLHLYNSEQDWQQQQATERIRQHIQFVEWVNAGGDPFETEPSPYFSPRDLQQAQEGHRSALTRGM